MRGVHAYGLEVDSGVALPGLHAGAPAALPRVSIRLAPVAEVLGAWSGSPTRVWETTLPEGAAYRLERGTAGDHLITQGDDVFHVDRGASLVRCAPAQPAGPLWQRALLDAGLAVVALLRGYELLHATAVRTRLGVVAIAGETGAGKSTLARELLDRGARLVADDLVALRHTGNEVLAHPAPALANVPSAWRVADHLGRVLATVGERDWTRIDRACARAEPVSAIVLLSAGGPGRGPVVAAGDASPLALYPHLLGLRWFPERAAARLDLLADLLAATPVLRLERGGRPPAELAAALEDALETAARAVGAVAA